MAKRLLRGVIDFGDGRLTVDNQNVNYQRLSRSGFEWHNPDERKIFTFIKEYVQENHEPPSAAIIRDFFDRMNELTVTEKLLDIKAVEVYVRTHYETLLKSLLEEQNQNKFRKLVQETEEIATKGRIINKEMVKGVKSALLYFNQKVYEAIPADSNARTEGDVLQDASQAWDEYQEAKINKNNVYGRFTGLEAVDKVCHGIKRGELWVHAAAPGQLKTTFALNWAYNLVTRYRANVLYVSLEMKYEHLRRLVCVLHTANNAFRSQGYKPLDYRKVRDGELLEEDEAFYKKSLDDFENNSEYHRFRIWAPDHDVTIGDIRVYAELVQKSMDIGLIVIDHGGLVKASRAHKDFTIELNSVLRESKKLALQFNGGAGIPVLMLFQINRQGQEIVEKKKGTPDEGLYNFAALAYANEAERSADYVTTTYLNPDRKKEGVTIMANLKNRDNELFPLTRVRVDFECRRMRNWEPSDQSDIGHEEISQEAFDLVSQLV
jgi:replicative DNA helicase